MSEQQEAKHDEINDLRQALESFEQEKERVRAIIGKIVRHHLGCQQRPSPADGRVDNDHAERQDHLPDTLPDARQPLQILDPFGHRMAHQRDNGAHKTAQEVIDTKETSLKSRC
jgi:hypothetical protein